MNYEPDFWDCPLNMYLRYACISYPIPHFSENLKLTGQDLFYVKHRSNSIDEIYDNIEWCEENCISPWLFNAKGFAFVSSIDAALFKLMV